MKSCKGIMPIMGGIMPSVDDKGMYRVQVSISKAEYELIRMKAYEMDMTVNMAIKKLALMQVRKE